MSTTVDEPTIVGPDVDTDRSLLDMLAPYVENEDPDRRTHIVRPADNPDICQGQNLKAQDIVDYGRMHGVEVVALCGYKWVPQHNPANYEACQPCFKVAEWIMSGKVQ